jgi:methyl-accepting chemotaxis protein
MDSSFLTGYEPVDTQHGRLFDAINSLLEACEQGKGREELKKSLDFLSDYTVKHFFDEEQMLKKQGFTALPGHHQYHEAFKKTVTDLAHEFIMKGASESLIKEVEVKIGSWLVDHIKGQDFRWARELKEKKPELFKALPPAAPPPPKSAARVRGKYVMDASFLTGCALVDAQHGQLFDAINLLLEACEQGKGQEELKKSLDFLSDYTVKHFFDEEQLLKKYGFSALPGHHQYHEAFKKTVTDLAHEFILKGVSEGLIKSVEVKIGSWLVDHIKGQDFRWARELKEKAPQMFAQTPDAASPAPASSRPRAAAAGPASPARTPMPRPVAPARTPEPRPVSPARRPGPPSGSSFAMDPSFLTGCAVMDAQHAQLFEVAGSLLNAYEQGGGKDELQKSLDFLADYTVKHFFDEEQMTKKYGFSDQENHTRYHESFKDSIKSLLREFILKGFSEGLVKEVQGKITGWLIGHIKGEDFRWAKELREKAPELFTGKAPAPPAAPTAAYRAGAKAADQTHPAGSGPKAGPAGSIRRKLFTLILALSLASFTGFGILVYNGLLVQKISRKLTGQYNQALARDFFAQFNSYLDTIQASSGISQDLGETFYLLKDALSREELAEAMAAGYRRAFAREHFLLGGGAFYEPNVFYQDVRDFHYFASKDISAGVPSENNVQWLGNEWEWDVDTYEQSWYVDALPKGWDRSRPREKRYHWSELYVDTSVNALMVSVCLPIYSRENRIVGVATVDVSLSSLETMVSSFTLPTPSAKIAGFSTINNAVFAQSGKTGTEIVPYPQHSWLSQLARLKPGEVYDEENLLLDGERYTLMASAHVSGIGMAILVPNQEKFQTLDALRRGKYLTVVTISLVMAGIIFAVILALTRWIVKPIKQVSQALETLAQGDLTQTISPRGGDELAQMARTLGETQESLKSLIRDITGKARDLSAIGMELQDMMAGSVSVINRINGNTQAMKAKSADQSSRVVKTNATMGRIILNIENLNGHIEKQSRSIAQSSGSIENMIANISSITANLTQNEQDLRRLREGSSQGNAALQKVSADIQEVSKESERLLEINKVIQNIASQTNLLAMNAAIEAAHAGDVGRGFAVVADEIRKLAESSSRQAKTVSGVLKNIKDALGGISAATLASLKQFEDIDAGFETASTQGMAIRNAMEQQDAGNKEILENISISNEITQNVKNNSTDIQSGSQEVIGEGKNLELLTGEVTREINEIAQDMDNISSAIARTSEISQRNRQDMEALLQEIGKFKL